MKSPLIYSLVAASAALMIAGCGGGGGGGGGFPSITQSAETPAGPATDPGSTSASTKLSGQAATGSPIPNGTVTAHCATGTALTGTTDAAGAWSLTLDGQTLPCLVSVSGGTLPEGRTLYSVATAIGHTNVTPLTDLIVANAAGSELDSLTGGSATALGTVEPKLAAAQANVYASLAASGYPSLAELTDPFNAAFTPQAGDLYDDTISLISVSIGDTTSEYRDLVAQVAAAGTAAVPIPRTYLLKSADLAAMPQINKAALTSAGGVLSMALSAGADSPVGSFVGGGMGNKSILQLPGLTGTKLIDFKTMSLELRGDGGETGVGVGKPYVYVNLMVDLQCSAAPLPADATLADVRARRRIVIFDPFYKFIQQDNAISGSEFSTISFTRNTGGWRVSAGTSVGTGVALGNEYGGLETLEGFDFAAYPNACITEGISGDGGMFREPSADPACNTSSGLATTAPAICGKPHGGALVVLGDSGSSLAVDWKIKKVGFSAFNPRTYRFE